MNELEKMEEKKWSLKRALVNQFKWDKNDWEYIKTHITWILIILLLSYLYYTETKVAREAVKYPADFCLRHGYMNYSVPNYDTNLKTNLYLNLSKQTNG